MIKELLIKIIDGADLSKEESYNLMTEIMEGRANNSELAGLLTALKAKGESAEEVAGFAMAMRDKSIRFSKPAFDAIDVCGTGGDNSDSFNISTAAAFVAAGAGVKVAKHGNRAVSGKCGSADVLTKLGVNIGLNNLQAEEVFYQTGITFLFAPHFHPAMKYAAPVRKELGFKTIFNMLGPLTNPAGVQKQIIGVFNDKAAKVMAKAAISLNYKRACFFCTDNSIDEIHLGGTVKVYEVSNNSEKPRQYNLINSSFNYKPVPVSSIKGGNADHNAEIISGLLHNRVNSDALCTVSANAAFALYCAGVHDDLSECARTAEESVRSGAALKKLNQLIEATNSYNEI